MMLKNEFVVEAPMERVWALFDEMERVVPCMPGAAYIGRDGDRIMVGMKVKVGPVMTQFQGAAQILEKNLAARTVVMRGCGKDSGGKGATSATITAVLHALSPLATRVTLDTDLAMTGRLAQFGGSVVTDIASRLIGEFARNLHTALIAGPAAPGTSAMEASTPTQASRNESSNTPSAFDAGSLAGSIFGKRLRQYGPALLTGFVLGWLLRTWLA
jgi:carbon monoxide dehydrogenase subunit G